MTVTIALWILGVVIVLALIWVGVTRGNAGAVNLGKATMDSQGRLVVVQKP